ncbi:MAG TPA: ABC transporter ATP-binding protein [Streptosporangiaceae bacterium]
MTGIVEVSGLRVEAPSGEPIVEDVSFSLAPGEALGLVGESGSGKTTTALALLGYTQAGARITSGSVRVAGTSEHIGDERAQRKIRGRFVSYVPQNPATALNPALRIGDAIAEMLRAHGDGRAPGDLLASRLENVGLPGDATFRHRYPHQLSGGQQQRVCISVALACEPPVVVLDEPTTGLDVVTQARILDELMRLRREQGISLLYVTHDLAVAAQIATRIAVMYAGRIVEEGPAAEVLRRPRHPYTRGLLTLIPDHVRPRALEPMPGVAAGVGERPAGCSFAPRCPLRVPECVAAVPGLLEVGAGHAARCVRSDVVGLPDAPVLQIAARPHDDVPPVLEIAHLRAEHRRRGEEVVAVQDVSLRLGPGRCVALVGESGSGKTTVARTIVGLHPIAAGQVLLHGSPLASAAKDRSVEQRRKIQIIFQNPGDSLNPRQTVRACVARPAAVLRGLAGPGLDAEVTRLLELVRLPARIADRYPRELSGGERQRVSIARALAAGPEVLVCDEITSALDVSVQAAVLRLLDELRAELGLALLFITHDLGVVAAVADEVLVLERGVVCESGPVGTILGEPAHPYTQRLLAAAPSISHAMAEWEAEDGLNARRATGR